MDQTKPGASDIVGGAKNISPKVEPTMTPRQKAAIKELQRRQAQSKKDFRKGAFPQQIDFLEDTSQFKIAHCSRGAAKSYTAGLGMFEFMQEHPNCYILYVTKTHDQARMIMWDSVMKKIAKDFNVPIDFNETRLEGRHPNGSLFRLVGIDGDAKQQNKLLGGKPKLVILDEVAFFDTDLTEIVYKTFIPASGRVGGSIWLMSTSSDYTRGLFYEATRPEIELRTPGWSVHEWQWSDNPYIQKEMQKTLDQLVAANPNIVNTNHYKQHYLNLWVVDDSVLVYRYSPTLNHFDVLRPDLAPPGLSPELLGTRGWSFFLGVDLGWEDDTAFVVGCYHENDPTLYIGDVFCSKQMTFNQVDDKVQAFMKQYPITRVIIDGANKQGVESMRARSLVPYELADKQDKVSHIELFNADLVQGKVKIGPNATPLVREMQGLLWVKDGDKPRIPKKENPQCSNHLCDAALYMWRLCYHHHWQERKQKLIVGSPQWYTKQSEEIWEREYDKIQQQQQAENYFQGWPSDH